MGTFLRVVTFVVALGVAALAASTATAAVTGTVTCVDAKTVLLTVNGLTPDSTVSIQKIVNGAPGDPEQYATTATGTFTKVFNLGVGQFPATFHVVDDTTGLNTNTDPVACGGKSDCGGYAALGFTNRGQCVSFYATKGKRNG